MNSTETLHNHNSTIFVLIGYNRKSSTANLHIYKIKSGKFISLQKMFLKSESVKTFTIYNRFYFVSFNRLGTGSIYKWTNSGFVFHRNIERKFNYFQSENDDVIVTIENNRIEFYTEPELDSRTSDSLPITNQTDLIIHRDFFIEFYIERLKMTIKFRKFDKIVENEKTVKKSRDNSLYDCLKSLKTVLIDRRKKINEIEGKSQVQVKPELTVRNSRIERIKVNLKPVISPNQLIRRITVLEMRLDDIVRRKREIEQIKLSTIVVNNLIHTGDIFKGEFAFFLFFIVIAILSLV